MRRRHARSGDLTRRGPDWDAIEQCLTPEELDEVAARLHQEAREMTLKMERAASRQNRGQQPLDTDWWYRITYARDLKLLAAGKAADRAGLMRRGLWPREGRG